MFYQPDLFKKSIDDRFRRFHRDHPEVFHLFCQIALSAYRSGRPRYGAKMIMDRIRWEYDTLGGKPFKIDNSLTSRYAREAIKFYPELDGFFELRQLTSA